ncbi:PREDICTED: ankyrin repeat-containing protein At5g02620 isoform X2 [Theobroma cacao]|nr:PREDICTED: ankyrin repeat-containing protein At5g02620 isoform X2 [Theobroma cacao]
MFVDSPLHIAASSGQSRFAMEMINLMPSFTKKLNKSGLSPMHLALLNGYFELVSLFVHADPGLVRVKGRGGLTPLHYATKHGNIHLMVYFLLACPESIEDVTVRGETVLHIAVKTNMLEALEVLIGWLQRVCHKDALDWKKFIPNWRDEQGNAALDIAVSNMQIQAIQLLAEIKAKNSKGEDASQILQGQTQLDRREVLKMLRRSTSVVKASSIQSTERLTAVLRSKTRFQERFAIYIARCRMRISDDVINALLVVAGLILAATYQTIYNPPGSVHQDNIGAIKTNVTNSSTGGGPLRDVEAGTVIMSGGDFTLFSVCNSLTLYLALNVISLLVPDDFFGRTLKLLLSWLALCYYVSILIISPSSSVAPVICTILAWLLFSIVYNILSVYSRKFCAFQKKKQMELQQLIRFYDAKLCPEELLSAEVQRRGAAAAPGEETCPEINPSA